MGFCGTRVLRSASGTFWARAEHFSLEKPSPVFTGEERDLARDVARLVAAVRVFCLGRGPRGGEAPHPTLSREGGRGLRRRRGERPVFSGRLPLNIGRSPLP